jgi:signal transduction histidine kinase
MLAYANAAHDFKSPINGIVQSLNMLEDLIELDIGKMYYNRAKTCSNLMLYMA